MSYIPGLKSWVLRHIFNKERLKRTHSAKKWHFEWQDYVYAMVDCFNLQVAMDHGKPDLSHITFAYPEKQYPCVAYAFNDIKQYN